MRKISITLAVLAMLAVAAGRIGRARASAASTEQAATATQAGQLARASAASARQAATATQAGQPAPAAARGRANPPTPVFPLADNFLQWRLLPNEQAYAAIDGAHLLQYVNDLAAVSRRYRDAGHPQF